ncbi:response regulator [Stutzerimonas azotifigens]|uniref:response regulator n=1 Tax=Stutzerimonas azotifigens TaxID=291995 RepID=UPI00047FD0F7|nr:response regulator [Stutzerimonas azotifigens]
MTERQPMHVLIADDDPDDCLLVREAFRECGITNPVRFVHNGQELLDYLRQHPPYDDQRQYPLPGLILLDLNMPLKDGREALIEIKSDAQLRAIPVVVMSTTSADEDIVGSYRLGSNSFITKPASFNGLLDVVKVLGRYWLGTVKLPGNGSQA